MNHCFDTTPLGIDKLSECLADITKQLINNTSGDIIDIGAYQGLWTDYVYNNCQDSSRNIILYEPNKTSYKDLIEKYKYVKRIMVNNLAIYSKRGDHSFYDDGPESVISENMMSYTVPATTLDSLYSLNKKKIGILKVRTNGNEAHILSGAQTIISTGKVESLLFQISPWQFTNYTDASLIEKYLISLLQHYKYVYILNQTTMKLHKCEAIMDVIDLINHINYCDMYECICTSFALALNKI